TRRILTKINKQPKLFPASYTHTKIPVTPMIGTTQTKFNWSNVLLLTGLTFATILWFSLPSKPEKKKTAVDFSEEDLRIAASWWAQFLPGRNRDKKNSPTKEWLEKLFHIKKNHYSVTDEQYEKFVASLIEKMRKLEVRTM